MKIKISEIIVKNRIREDIGNLDSLMKSIEKYGLLHPIIINEEMELLAGERRLTACKNLGWEEIEANIVSADNNIDKLEVETHENVLRKDLSQTEIEEIVKRKKQLLTKNRGIKVIFAPFIKFFQWLKNLFTSNKK